MPLVCRQFRFRKDDGPCGGTKLLDGCGWRETALERRAIGIVALVMIGVDLDFRDVPDGAEPDDRPITMIEVAASLRLPSIAHVLRTIGHEQRALGAVVRIACSEEQPAIGDRCQI